MDPGPPGFVFSVARKNDTLPVTNLAGWLKIILQHK